jgi:chemotaxis methyl-accepting protein methylase/PAS domain-containing protein
MATPANSVISLGPAPLDEAGADAFATASASDFPIVGIGCSAGGLDALEKFFSHAPANGGMAFVVVQHLAPAHVSALPELLQRTTRLKVVEAGDGVTIAPDSVYVIPPNKDLSLLHGRLHLLEPVERRGLRLPIDFFLRTLAEDRQEKAIGVILSGMGSDGMFGLRAIKEKGGLTLVQDPASASADSMPRSAIEAGVADIIAVPEDMPARIAAYLKHPLRVTPVASLVEDKIQSDLDKIVILLRDRCGSDFTLYKTNTLVRRIERRIALHQLDGITGYVRYLRGNPHEIDLLFKELLIGVTNFFRDTEVWELLRGEVIPELFARYPAGREMRAWVPACSSGEEAYSWAMVFKEALEQVKPSARFKLLIYATDLDPEAIEKARKGLYPGNIVADVAPERLSNFFVEESGSYRINKDIREMVVFAQQNIISDPPFTKLDILSCRNLLIYFRPQLQKKLLPLFHYALNPGGVMLLGSAEVIGNLSNLFAPLNHKARLFRSIEQPRQALEVDFPARGGRNAAESTETLHAECAENIGVLTDTLIQQHYAPAAVLVNADGDILYISGRTGKYLEPAAGKVNMNIYAMARPGLREALTGLIHRALREAQPIHIKGLRVGTNGGTQVIHLTVEAVLKPDPLAGRVILVFSDIETPKAARKRHKSVAADAHEALLQELQQTRETLQVTHEEMQTSMEELKSSNEELQSTNEELQSTNEELTTSKEEMQSLNEELQTVNTELQSKVEDLGGVKSDMANLLNSTEIATVFLDNAMKLRRFTSHATKLFKLIPGDIGRPLSDVACELDYPQLEQDSREVQRTLVFRETQAGSRSGRWYRVRIMPYRTQDNVIDGVVITFTDISEVRKLQDELNARAALTPRAGPA